MYYVTYGLVTAGPILMKFSGNLKVSLVKCAVRKRLALFPRERTINIPHV